jgi:hypothetical protein
MDYKRRARNWLESYRLVSFIVIAFAFWRQVLRSRPVRHGCRPRATQFSPAVMMGSGGSITVVDQIKCTLNIDSLLMGFGLDDDQVHSPNEKFETRCFHRGTRSHALQARGAQINRAAAPVPVEPRGDVRASAS